MSQRTRELAIRVVLGARPSDVLRLVAESGFLPVVGGVILGLALSLMLSRALSSKLFGVKATDPVTYVLVAAALSGAALVACYLPARRAMGVDPNLVLRAE